MSVLVGCGSAWAAQVLGRSELRCCKVTYMQSSVGGYCFVQKLFVYFMGGKVYQLKFACPFYEEHFCNKWFYCLQVKPQVKCSTWGNSAWGNSEITWAVCVAGAGAVWLLYSEGGKVGIALWWIGDSAFSYILRQWPPILPIPVWKHGYFFPSSNMHMCYQHWNSCG